MDMPLWLIKLRYPMPELGDFAEDIPVDTTPHDDHNDQDAANREPKPRGKK